MTTNQIILLVLFIGVLYLANQFYQKRKRKEYLLEKYGNYIIVNDIMNRLIWQGMTEEQLIDSWGHPDSKDNKFYKTKTVEIFKYSRAGKNRYRERVTVENGVVVGWHQRGE